MCDELARIERNFGCVAEYNRQMEERNMYEPTETEKKRYYKMIEEADKNIKRLNGEPTEYAKELKVELDRKLEEIGDDNEHFYERRDLYSKMEKEYMEKICRYHKKDFEYGDFYGEHTPCTFSVKIEYTDFCNIKSLAVTDLNFEEFCNIFRDLEYLDFYPTAMYEDKTALSNLSLGRLLYYDYKEIAEENGIKTRL